MLCPKDALSLHILNLGLDWAKLTADILLYGGVSSLLPFIIERLFYVSCIASSASLKASVLWFIYLWQSSLALINFS